MTNASDEIIIIGDFNLPGISWSSSCNGFLHIDMERSSLHSHASKLLDYYSTATLRQINHVTNENNRNLDLCFVSAQDATPLILHAPSPLVKEVNNHPSLILKLNNTRANVVASIEPIIYNFHNADHHSIAEFFATLDWVDILGGCDAENAALTLSHIIGHVIERHVPKKIVAPYSCPWKTRQLRRMKTPKRAALKRYSKHGSLSLREHFKKLNSAYKIVSRLCFSQYQQNIQQNLRTRNKTLWKYINEQRNQAGLPTTMTLDEEVASTPQSICQLFADKFVSTYCNEVISDVTIAEAANNVPAVGITWATFFVDAEMIRRANSQLKSSMSPGPDGIPSAFLKRHIELLLAPFQLIFNKSLSSGLFPSVWKTATMFPVYKKGDRKDVNNYRDTHVIEKASRTLGFIFRVAKGFTDVYCLKSLYCSLVRSTLEYCSAVWHPNYQNGSHHLLTGPAANSEHS
ncbi:uncharacterized protein LOC134206265 [Armigeres subalbatus]|uniref:uncharacterized protein LOC134206265 n=1 Tax=Armigeres subalbatus TaxID=124917 RepID=UPI002ED4136B